MTKWETAKGMQHPEVNPDVSQKYMQKDFHTIFPQLPYSQANSKHQRYTLADAASRYPNKDMARHLSHIHLSPRALQEQR